MKKTIILTNGEKREWEMHTLLLLLVDMIGTWQHEQKTNRKVGEFSRKFRSV